MNRDRNGASDSSPNGGDAPPDLETPLLLSDLRLEELIEQHDRIMAELETPDPLVEAYAAGIPLLTPMSPTRTSSRPTNTVAGEICTDDTQYEELRRPVKVGSLRELQAHLDHGRRSKELRETRHDLLATMLREGMPLDVWVLAGGERYVRLEQRASPSRPTAKPEGIEPDGAPSKAFSDSSPDAPSSTSPPPQDEQETDSVLPVLQNERLAEQPATPKDSATGKRLLFYSVRREALDGLPAGVPAEEVEQISRRIENFEALPRIRRFGMINYPFLALICLVAFWLFTPLFGSFLSVAFILLPPIVFVAILHVDSGLNGPRAIRDHERSLIELARSKKKVRRTNT